MLSVTCIVGIVENQSQGKARLGLGEARFVELKTRKRQFIVASGVS